MAATVSFNGTRVANADALTETNGTWGEDGATTAPELWTEVKIQNTGSVATQASNKDGAEYFAWTGTDFDFTPTTGANAGDHVYMWVNMSTLGTLDTVANNGIALRLYSDTTTDLTNWAEWTIGGSDDLRNFNLSNKGFVLFVLDPTKTPTATNGTWDYSTVDGFGVWVNTTSASRADNLFLDAISVGKGLTVTGTSTNGWEDVYDWDMGTAANTYGILQKVAHKTYLAFGGLTVGDDTGATATTFSDDSATISFISQEYWTGSAWVPMAADGFMSLNISDHASNSTSFTDGIIVGSDNGRNGCTYNGAPLTTSSITLAGGNHSSSTTLLYGTNFNGIDGGILWTNNANHKMLGGSVSQCGQFDPVGAPVIRNSTFSGYTGTTGALLWNSLIDVQYTNFISNDRAIEIDTAISPNFTALTFSGNTYDVNNSSGSAITVYKLSGSNPSTYIGSTVTFSASFTLTLTNIIQDSQVTIVNSSTRTELQNSTAGVTGVVTYGHSGGETVDIMFMHLDYDPNLSDIYSLTLPNADSTIKIQMIDDANYDNPA